MAKSLQDRLKQRRSSTFVGREQQLELFRQNLSRSLDSEDYFFIFNVHGQGGVGKSTLLKKYDELAKAHKAITAYINEDTKDLPEMLADFARQLEAQDAPLKKFDKQYKTYLQEKKRLEADPEAPKSTWSYGGRLLARGGKALLKTTVPGSEFVLEDMDADALGDQLGEWASFVKKRLTNKDEVQLLLEPIEVLTPMFLEGLREYAEKPKICLFFDTYEVTHRYADEWLRQMLNGKHGDAPENLLLIIAGREELNPNDWSNFGSFLTSFPLEEFTEIEAKTYLERKGITDLVTVNTILHLSGRLPVWLVTLSDAAANSPTDLTDPSASAVERFLWWIEDPVQRDLALHASLPRKLNQDIVKCLLPEGSDAGVLFKWLCGQPFVKKRKSGDWGYHDVVRDLMLRHQYQLSQDIWSSLHLQLAAFYEKRAEGLGIEGREDQFRNDEWLAHGLEVTYHRLSSAYSKELPYAVANFATRARLKGFRGSISWSETIYQSGKIHGNTEIGELLRSGAMAIMAKEWEDCLPMFSKINSDFKLTEVEDAAYFLFMEGVYEMRGDKSKKAIECYQKVIDLKPDYVDAWYYLGNIYSSIEQNEKAIECYQKVIDLKPDYERSWNNIGYAYYSLGQNEKAIECYEKAIDIIPDLNGTWFFMGNAYSSLGQWEKAIECYQKAIELKPDIHEAWNNMGNAYSILGQKEKAIECCKKTIELKPDDYRAWYNIGNIYSSLRQKKKAIEYYQKAIDLKPDNEWTWSDMGEVYSSLGQKEKAIECYQKAIDLKPDYEWAWYRMGIAYSSLGQWKKAIECYQKAIDLKPEEEWTWTDMGYAYFSLGQKEKAIECYEKAIDLKPDMGGTWRRKGYAYSSLGKWEKAIECYEKAIDLKPDDHITWRTMGNAYSSLGQQGKGIKCYEKSIKIKPNYHFAYADLGDALYAQGKLDEAIIQYRKVIKIKPDYHYFYGNLGDAYRMKGEEEQAKIFYEKQIEVCLENIKKNPSDADALSAIGWVYLLLNDMVNAEIYLQQSWEASDFKKANSPMNLGHIQLFNGKHNKAIELYKTSLKLYHSKEAFFKAMNSDYTDLNMQSHGITRTQYDTLLSQLKSTQQ